MARCATLVPAALALLLLLTLPGLAWYKPATGPRHYSVGRAAGLLSNFHRSMSTRRSESPVPFVGTVHPRRTSAFSELLPSLRTLAVCVKDITPNLQSCERLLDSQGTFQCKADVFLSLHKADCHST